MAESEIKNQESFRDRIGTVDETGHRNWIYALKPKGRFYNIRTYVSWFFFILFLALPFIYVNGRPLFMFNVPKAKFIVFGHIFWPQDFFIFAILMITFVVSIVLFTSAFGRLFCGWICPQTIFMEMVFRKIEYAIEGDAPQQKLLAASPWTTEKIAKKLTKHVVFYLLAFIIANFFLAYIISVTDLWAMIQHPFDNVGTLIALMVFSAVFYGVYAFFREQACIVVCPYGRLQSVLLDRNSMVVAYDYKRGEERKKFNKKEERTAGDCIDCKQCVKVCPTGIDIRNGTQMECVGCTACIDACDNMMDSVGFKRGLIRYASENGIANHEKLQYTRRMRMYTVLLVVLISLLTILLLSQKDVKATVLRSSGLLYQERGTDSISNLYNIKVSNKTMENIPLTVKLEGTDGTVQMVGDYVHVKAEEQGQGSFFIILPKKAIQLRKTPLKVAIYNGDKKIDVLKTNFLGPVYSK